MLVGSEWLKNSFHPNSTTTPRLILVGEARLLSRDQAEQFHKVGTGENPASRPQEGALRIPHCKAHLTNTRRL